MNHWLEGDFYIWLGRVPRFDEKRFYVEYERDEYVLKDVKKSRPIACLPDEIGRTVMHWAGNRVVSAKNMFYFTCKGVRHGNDR